MKIHIELIIIVIIVLVILAWTIWYKISTKRARKKYNPDNDKGRKGEEERKRLSGEEQEIGGTSARIDKPDSDAARQTEPSEQPLLQTGITSVDDKNNSSSGKTSRSIRKGSRNPFRRRAK